MITHERSHLLFFAPLQLCVIDTVPHHEFTAEQYNLLTQFAELVVREIEKDKASRSGGVEGLGALMGRSR